MAFGNGAETNATPGASPAEPKAAPKQNAKRKPVKTTKREPSTIQFPYRDLDVAVSVALAMIGAGGVPLSTEQLAGVMGLQIGSGNFVMKVATARIFGLVTYSGGKYELTNSGFAIVDKDEKRQRAARAEAFLKVALYRRVYDEFKGKQQPPRPHALEQAFVRFGVSPKQKETARQIFDKSANQAGFFSTGQDRLVEPIIGASAQSSSSRASNEDVGAQASANTGSNATNDAAGPNVSGFHPFIQGLLDRLPEPDTVWAIEGRAKWLLAAANCFDLLYQGDGEISVTFKATPHNKE
jgi:hypothetical protein